MKLIICNDYAEISEKAAEIFADVLKAKPNAVLGLATGSTPEGLYAKLAEMNKAGKIDFSKAVTYNLDEYYPLVPTDSQSYRYFMNQHLFNLINIDKNNTHVPDGTAKDPDAFCASYDAAIEKAGGIDLQLLGIGENGHIGFNEPADAQHLGTHLTGLTEDTIRVNSRFFEKEEDVPRHAITLGIGEIMKAKKVILLASGKKKAPIIGKLFGDDTVSAMIPASFLKLHDDVIVLCDKEAAALVH